VYFSVVVIVGGGLGGLTAAAQLSRLGVKCMLLDDNTDLGGRARTERHHGFALNYGPHRLYEDGAAVSGLRSLEIPIDAAARGPNGGYAVWRGRKHTLPVGLCSLMTTGLLGPRAKREIASVMAAVGELDRRSLRHVSIGEWVRTQIAADDVRQVVLAFVRHTTYCDDPGLFSAEAAIDQLQLSLRSRVLYIHNGWRSLIDSLATETKAAAGLVVRGTRVQAIDIRDERASAVILSDGSSVPARAVILAVGPRAAERILGGVPICIPNAAVRVAALDVALERLPDPRAVFAVGIDQPWCFSADSTIARVAPNAGGLVHLAKYLPTGVDGSLSDESELEQAMDLLQPGWRRTVVYRRFLPTIVVSHALVSAGSGGFAGRPRVAVPMTSNVFLAGDWVGTVGQLADACVSSALEAARRAALCV
jgi:glycine/D-amino acid oxidase-like deaminating enzyme